MGTRKSGYNFRKPLTTTLHSLQKTILRQNSENIGAFAGEAVLPRNQRSAQNIPTHEVELEEIDRHTYRTTVTAKRSIQMQPKYFPFFMIGISAIQVTKLRTVGRTFSFRFHYYRRVLCISRTVYSCPCYSVTIHIVATKSGVFLPMQWYIPGS